MPSGFEPLESTEIPVLASDIVGDLVWIVGGILLWLQKRIGNVLALTLFYQGTALFVGLICFLLLQPALFGGPDGMGEVIPVLVMGIPVYVIFALFLRKLVRPGLETRSGTTKAQGAYEWGPA